jgi:galactokinase
MTVAVDSYVAMASSPRTDGRIELASSASTGRESFRADQLTKNPAAPWADRVKGVLEQLRKRRIGFSGFNAAIHIDHSLRPNMGSSAELEVVTALTVRKLSPFTLTAAGVGVPPARDRQGQLPALSPAERLEFSRLCHAAATRFAGLECALADPISSLFGKAWTVVDIDCRSLTVEHAPLPGEAIVVCHPHVETAPTGGADDEPRRHCEAAAKKLGAKSLRSVELKQLEAHKPNLSQREYECARHAVSETLRVVGAERALRDDDHRQFGQYLVQSHASSRDLLKNSTPELDTLIELASRHRGCLGARGSEGSAGRATINLVQHHEAQPFLEYIQREYATAVGAKLTTSVCRIVDGAD